VLCLNILKYISCETCSLIDHPSGRALHELCAAVVHLLVVSLSSLLHLW